jgi:anhydro-N-acetylmuramic acid kinase
MTKVSSQNKSSALTVAGMMSGTSADGVDVAIVRIRTSDSGGRKLKLLHQSSYPYSATLRSHVIRAMDARSISTAELARLNWRLGIAYAEAAEQAIKNYGQRVDLVGCHGQTIYHQGISAPYAGRNIACTWQLGEMALLTRAVKLPVVSNFRPADMVAGGHGAPLVSYLDWVLFQNSTRNRVLQNLGGIGNLTVVPAGASADQLLAFDTGPANMIIDAMTQTLYGQPYDRGGKIAERGSASKAIVAQAMRDPYFRLSPPKSAGREQFGERYSAEFLKVCRKRRLTREDTVATATAFTVESIRSAYEVFVQPLLAASKKRALPTDYIVAGGGARNATLMRMLTEALEPFHCLTTTTDTFDLPVQAKEAAAFALLAYETWHHRPSNVPAATGARCPAILGQVSYFA